jgi:hypothetical protein
MDKNLHAFDAIVQVSCRRIMEPDVMIARGAARFGLPLLFVHSKMDADVADLEDRTGGQTLGQLWEMAATELLGDIEQKIRPVYSAMEPFLVSVRMSRRGTLPLDVGDGVAQLRARLVALASK